jgi:predicted enzyme related to lactoylglutathione lyase
MAGLGFVSSSRFLYRYSLLRVVCTGQDNWLWHRAPARAAENGPMAERIIHFEITADDPERAAAFSRETFGWTLTEWEGPANYWLVSTGEGLGIDGAITGRTFEQAVINTVQVEGSLEDAVARVRKAQGRSSTRSTPFPASAGSRTSRTSRTTSSA